MIFTSILKIIESSSEDESLIVVVGDDVLFGGAVPLGLSLVEGAEPRHILLDVVFGLMFHGVIAGQVFH